MGRLGSEVWAVILAGGDGARLQSLTTKIEGDMRPKQFCRILGAESLLTRTRRRISPLFQADRMILVVTKKHETFYLPELSDWPSPAVLAQPDNRGTGAAIATAILKRCDLKADAVIAVFPCDHHYMNEAAFLDVMAAGVQAARDNRVRLDRAVAFGTPS